jgi:hypothetical protein
VASTADDANAAGARINVDAAAPIAVSAWRRLNPTDDGAFAASCASCARDDDGEDDDDGEVAIVIIVCALRDRRVGARTDAGAHANEDANITTTVTL